MVSARSSVLLICLALRCGSPPPRPTSQVPVAAQAELERLREALELPDSVPALLAAEQLAAMERAAVPALTVALRHGGPGARRLSAYALGRIGPAASPSLPELLTVLGGADPEAASMADWAISEITGTNPPLAIRATRALRFGNPIERQEGAWKLILCGPQARAVYPLLMMRLRDSMGGVRSAAADALVLSGADVWPYLRRELEDPDPAARVAAAALTSRVRPWGF
jgi:HEAT repeat protein